MKQTLQYTFIGAIFLGGLLLVTLPVATLHSSASLMAAVEEEPVTAPVPPPELAAKAAVIYDPMGSTILFEKNADAPLGIASITKIMTTLVALEHVGEDEVISISAQAVETEGIEGMLLWNEHFVLRDLIALMLTASSNDAAAAIAEHVGRLYGASSYEESQQVFTRMMNETAQRMGLAHTHFENPTGLDIDEDAGILSNVSTAKETARMIAHALRYPLLTSLATTPPVITSEEGFLHDAASTHVLLANEPGMMSGKTGFTDTAGGALATVTETPVGSLSIVIILGSTREGRFDDTLHLLDWLRMRCPRLNSLSV
mgnify:CR=1 FL=1